MSIFEVFSVTESTDFAKHSEVSARPAVGPKEKFHEKMFKVGENIFSPKADRNPVI